jgi:hypothetical protein
MPPGGGAHDHRLNVKKAARTRASERGQVVPADRLSQIENGEDGEHQDRDDLLHHLQLGAGIDRVTDAIGGDHETVLEKGDAPAHRYDDPQCHTGKAQMAVLGERHEHVRAEQQQDWQNVCPAHCRPFRSSILRLRYCVIRRLPLNQAP